MKPIVQKIALAFSGILFALLLCEGMIWLAPQKLLPSRLQELNKRMALYRATDGMFIADKELLFKIRPNYDAVVDHPDYHVRVKTHLNLDAIGFRGGSTGGPAWAVAVGDSFTFGVGVEQEYTWVYLLAKALGREIVNLGIPAQGPAQYTRVLKRYALPIRPKVVFYGFYFNDLDSANRFYRQQRTPIPVSRYLRQYSVLYNLVSDSRAAVAEAPEQFYGDGAAPNQDAAAIRRTLERQNRNFEHRWHLTMKELDEGLKASRDAKMELVLLYLPSRWEVYWESIKAQNHLPDSLDIDRLRRTVIEHCGASKIACLDLTPALKREAQQGRQLYFPIDGHWNKEGNRIVAQTLQNYLIAKGLAE